MITHRFSHISNSDISHGSSLSSYKCRYMEYSKLEYLWVQRKIIDGEEVADLLIVFKIDLCYKLFTKTIKLTLFVSMSIKCLLLLFFLNFKLSFKITCSYEWHSNEVWPIRKQLHVGIIPITLHSDLRNCRTTTFAAYMEFSAHLEAKAI